MKRNVWKMMMLFLLCMVCYVQAYTLLGRTTIFEPWDTIGGVTYECFRIPGIVQTSDGILVAFAEGRHSVDCNDEGDIDIVAAVSYDGGYNWDDEDRFIVHNNGGNRLHNPCPIYDAINDKIILIYGRYGKQVLRKICNDVGDITNPNSWSAYKDITSSVIPDDADPCNGIAGPGPSHGIQILSENHYGRLLVPYRYARKRVRLAYSDNGGTTWHYSNGMIKGSNLYWASEVCIAEMDNGNIYFNIRNENAQEDSEFCRIVYQSSDCLESSIALPDELTEPGFFDTELPDPRCAASVLKTDSNRILFANPASKTERKYMTIKTSLNQTSTWTRKKMVTSDPSGYSDLVEITYAGRNDIGILFETGNSKYHERIDFVLFGESWLTEPEVAVYEFEDESIGSYATSSDTIYNDICLGLNGAVTGSIKYVAGPQSDKALEFTSGDYITIDDTNTNNTLDFGGNETFYIDTWIRTTSHGSGGGAGSGAIVAKDNDSGSEPQWWLRVEDGYAKFLICDGQGHQPSVTSTVKVNRTTDGWVHIKAGRNADADRLEMYINNLDVPNNTATDTTTASLRNSEDLRIGNFNHYSRQFIGKISRIAVLFPED